jgi:hypothetical protein
LGSPSTSSTRAGRRLRSTKPWPQHEWHASAPWTARRSFATCGCASRRTTRRR